jgi:hypothetical protein
MVRARRDAIVVGDRREASMRESGRAVAAIEAIVGVGAVYGGYSLLTDPEGLGARQSWLDGSAFSDYTIPGLVLLVVIGGGMLAAAFATLFAPRCARLAALGMAAALALWGVVETLTIGWRGSAQLVLVAVFVAAPALALAVFGAGARRGGEG